MKLSMNSSNRSKRAVTLALPLAVTLGALLPGLALAHAGADAGAHHAGNAGWLVAGFLHPFTGIDHLLAMLALGAWSASGLARAPDRNHDQAAIGSGSRTASRRPAWAVPCAFMVAMLIGALLGRAGVTLPAVEPMIAASVMVAGLLVATTARLHTAAGIALASVFALFHGAAHGQEFGAASGMAALLGMLAASGLLLAAGAALGLVFRSRMRWLPRLAGGAVAAFGVTLLASMSMAA